MPLKNCALLLSTLFLLSGEASAGTGGKDFADTNTQQPPAQEDANQTPSCADCQTPTCAGCQPAPCQEEDCQDDVAPTVRNFDPSTDYYCSDSDVNCTPPALPYPEDQEMVPFCEYDVIPGFENGFYLNGQFYSGFVYFNGRRHFVRHAPPGMVAGRNGNRGDYGRAAHAPSNVDGGVIPRQGFAAPSVRGFPLQTIRPVAPPTMQPGGGSRQPSFPAQAGGFRGAPAPARNFAQAPVRGLPQANIAGAPRSMGPAMGGGGGHPGFAVGPNPGFGGRAGGGGRHGISAMGCDIRYGNNGTVDLVAPGNTTLFHGKLNSVEKNEANARFLKAKYESSFTGPCDVIQIDPNKVTGA